MHCGYSIKVLGMARGNFGERLKRERELREVTMAEITAATRIGPRFLDALENEDWKALPGGVFNRGFVRSVARYLGLDEESLLGEYDLAHGAPVTPVGQEDRIPGPSKWLAAAIFLGVLVVLAGLIAGGVYAWRYFVSRHPPKQPGVVLLDLNAPVSRCLALRARPVQWP